MVQMKRSLFTSAVVRNLSALDAEGMNLLENNLWDGGDQGILGPIVLKGLNVVGETRPNRQSAGHIHEACLLYIQNICT